jgi:plastocyanin
MKVGSLLLFTAALSAAVFVMDTRATAQGSGASTGTIRGHVKIMGDLPGNAVIRMGRDPKCNEMNRGKLVVQELVAASKDGSLGNVFVKLEGDFPQTPVPATPVVLDQSGCIYRPRVIGARVGQTLEVRNSDNLMHNVHSITTKANAFNTSQPKAGMVFTYKLKGAEMLHLMCDIHSWMTAYVGVVPHPYFAVTGADGSYEIRNVPAGMRTISFWHEVYGMQTRTVTVRAGAVATVDFSYTGKPPAGRRAAGA